MDQPTAAAPADAPVETAGALGRIALGLSGGGYRATGYHLGALSLLERVGLLGDVVALSTVSGGTLTGARWAWGLCRGEPFARTRQALCDFLRGTDCVQEAIAAVGEKRATPSRRVSLITAAANLYATRLTPGATLGDLVDRCPQLEELCFNTTEFQSGLNFRFLKSESTLAPIGNGKYWIEPAAARQLRLGDVVAASSCFPGGFEPMGFPDDFVWPGGSPPAGPSVTPNALGRIPEGLALMDGGIFDNQGAEALIQAQARARRRDAAFGLVVISDVDQDPALLAPEGATPAAAEREAAYFRLGPQERGWLSFPLLRAGVWAVAVAALSSFGVLLADQLTSGRLEPMDWARRLFPMAVMLLVAGGAPLVEWWLSSKVRGQLSQKVGRLWAFVREQPLTIGKDLLMLRARSLFALTSKVFMRRIRTLSLLRLQAFFPGPTLVSNDIGDLLEAARVWEQHERYAPLPPPSAALLARARAAHRMDTTLWLEHPGQLDDLLITGEATLCLNLLVNVQARRGEHLRDARLEALEARLLEAWRRLNEAAPAPQGRVPQNA